MELYRSFVTARTDVLQSLYLLKRFNLPYLKQYFYPMNPTGMRKNYININFINFTFHLVFSGQLSDGEEAVRKRNPAFAAQYRNPN